MIRSLGLMGPSILAAGLLAATVGHIGPAARADQAPKNQGPTAPAKAPAAEPAEPAAPVLTTVTARVVLTGGQPAPIKVTGAHFEPGLSVTLSNPQYVLTFSAGMLEELTATSLRFDAGSLNEGTYNLSVRNPSGRRSNVVSVQVVQK